MCVCYAVIASQKLRVCVQKCKAAGIDCRLSSTARLLHSWLFRAALESLFFFPSFFCALFFSIYWTAWRVRCLVLVRVCFPSNSQGSRGTALPAELVLSSRFALQQPDCQCTSQTAFSTDRNSCDRSAWQ